ncbi:MAG: DUF488 family protein [Acidobacteriota bacterium]
MANKIIYTLGSSLRSEEEFLELVKAYHIQLVIDVRRFPVSKLEHFNKDNLSHFLRASGIEYLYMGEQLGGYRRGGYQSYTQTTGFQERVEEVMRWANRFITTLLCAERFPWKCHRRFIAQALEEKGWAVVHILEQGKTWVRKEPG